MITRSAKRKSMHIECDPSLLQVSGNEVQVWSQSSISVKDSGSVPLCNEQLQESIFNINIHSPVHEIRNVKITLPGTHSFVQVSFNEVLKTLELNIGNNSKKLTPILGGIQLPLENVSAKRNCLELGNDTSHQKSLTDIKKGSSRGSKVRCSTRSEKNNKTFKRAKEISSHSVDIDSIKLNKPVVVLTDICKSKYYKSLFTDQTPKDQVDISGIGTKNDFSRIKVKQENFNSSVGDTDNCCTHTLGNSLNTSPSLESVHSSSLSGSRLLTQLAEGCNFSEILNRFRIKNGKCLVDTLKCADTVNHENLNTEHLGGQDDLVFKSERVSYSEDEATIERFLSLELNENVDGVDFEGNKFLDFPQGSDFEEPRENVEHLRDCSLDSHMISDHNKNNTAVHSLSEDVTAGQGISDSPCLTSDMVSNKCNVIISEEISSVPETSDNCTSITNNSNLKLHESEQANLEMDKEIMKAKKFVNSNKSKSKKKKRSKSTSPKPPHSPSPKKMKQSNQKPNPPRGKKKFPDEYVPLNVSGPTKFGVAMLNQIKPYVHHDAKDFKNKMLFGDRIKRVSGSEDWRMYKLKQKVNRSIRK